MMMADNQSQTLTSHFSMSCLVPQARLDPISTTHESSPYIHTYIHARPEYKSRTHARLVRVSLQGKEEDQVVLTPPLLPSRHRSRWNLYPHKFIKWFRGCKGRKGFAPRDRDIHYCFSELSTAPIRLVAGGLIAFSCIFCLSLVNVGGRNLR